MLRFRLASLFCMAGMTAVGLLVVSVEPARASSIVAFASCSVSNVNNDEHTSLTPGVAANASLPAPHQCSSTAIADYGILELGTSITGVGFSGSASSQFTLNFTLSNPSLAANTPIVLQVPILYDLDLSVTPGGVGGTSNSADFAIYEGGNVNPFWTYRVSTSTDNNGGNLCPSPLAALPACNGHYQGTATALVNAFVNGGIQSIRITASETVVLLTDGTAVVDALHTITLGQILLPNGVAYAYDIGGNPANFTYAGPTDAAMPEPSTWCLLTGGLGMLIAARRRVGA